MKLIKIEAHGFKSFADKVTLNFDGGVVGIVGPNGSGKSNINDAIRWVLGEQSSKALRGDSMSDVIFAGSKTVAPLDKAEVILTFDNSENLVSTPHKIFTISRVLYRNKGNNEYYINGELAKQKDIKQIAVESGISKSSLAIISQGTISSIAEASSEYCRAILEDAAGTSKYKLKKNETLKKLEKTDESLEKITLVVNELNKQLQPLKKQAEKALLFLEKTEKLKNIEVNLLVHDITKYSEQLESLRLELSGVEQANTGLESRIDEIDLSLNQSSKNKNEVEKELNDLSVKLENISEKIKLVEITKVKENQRLQMIISGEIVASSEEKTKAIKQQIDELGKVIYQYQNLEKETEEKIENNHQKINFNNKEISAYKLQENNLVYKINNIKARISFLKENKEKKTHLFKGSKAIVDNSHLFKGYKGLVWDIIQPETKYSRVMDNILGNTVQNIVVDTPETAIDAINFLKRNNAGKATFVPLSSIKPKFIREEHDFILKNQKGFLGVASDLINVKPEFLVLKRFLLGNILVCDSVENANEIFKLMNSRYMTVSLDGDIIRVGGIISGGQKQEDDNFNNIDKQIEQLHNSIPQLEAEKKTLAENIWDLENTKNDLIVLNNELKSNLIITREKINTANNSFYSLKTRYEAATKEILDITNLKNDLMHEKDLELEKNFLTAEIRSKREKIRIINEELQKLLGEKNDLQKTQRELNNSFSVKLAEKSKAEFLLNNSQKRLSVHYKMTLEYAKENYTNQDLDLEKSREIVQQLITEIDALGHVNLDSIESFKEIEQRYNITKASQEELEKAKNIILGAIAEIDKIIVKKISETFTLVNKEFSNVFQKMFGGGLGQIKYTDPSNILDSGIDIVAQPPGKSIKNLRLFSGGEKALIAISLLFSIIKAKPIPLCILDEVEAALDEANVVRYAEFLQRLKNSTQFVVITHRHGTMARVDHLFGATMQKRGVTSFFSVELAKAKQLIERMEN
ncbi:AAA family ATPase [Mycoplasma iguanae]|uniref:Chromosome partition protein Smc n=1 Tax=Mycoplasma iguanae TaxID=292461 RepID=A0ABY5RBJ5_9MOLU|nr:AAA family ATPase [Mycoplasma iguanae]UVD81717.1 AAA family ATPase [Mycoplasma iguanae]